MKVNNKSRIHLSIPHMSGYELEYVKEAFDTNWVAPIGPHIDDFEKMLAEHTGKAGAVALNSGTAAIHLALRCLGVEDGDKVFCSSLTFVAGANPILYRRAEPVFIDSEPESWNMSPLALERAFEKEDKLPSAVIVVNLYGQSADMDKILEICDKYKVPVVEDAAESLGSTYRGRQSGSFGRLGILSFNGNKIITTSGGGALVSDDLGALKTARFLATQARDEARHYEHSEMGYNYRMSNVCAAIGKGQFKVLSDRIKKRRKVFQRYYDELSHIDGIEFMPEAEFGVSTRWLTALTVDPEKCGVTAREIIEALDEHNIESRPVWKPMHLQPLYAGCTYYPHSEGESISDRLYERGICLPSSSSLRECHQKRVIEALKEKME